MNVVNAETENKNDIKSDIKNDVKSDNKPENKTIKINVHVSYSLSEVVKEAAENFKQIYLKDNAKNDKKIDFEFNFFVNSNSMLLSKIAKDNQNFDLLFCDSQKISQIAIQKNLIHQNFAFLSDSVWVVVSKNLAKIPHNINELQDFHIHKILISQAEDDKIFKYIKNLFQQQENYKTWSVLQDQQNKIFYTTSSIQNLELLSNNQADASFALLSEATQFIDKDKLQIAFEIVEFLQHLFLYH
ncbi:MAG: substrate-binding domain-containing protein, partial [Rhodocyclaceae bacterium]